MDIEEEITCAYILIKNVRKRTGKWKARKKWVKRVFPEVEIFHFCAF